MSSVVSLHGKPLYTPETNAAVVASLEEWLERARSGEVHGIAIAALYRDDAVGFSYSGGRSLGLVGQLFGLAQRITQDMDDG